MITRLIQITPEDLANRGEDIRRLLRPLARVHDGPAWQQRTYIGAYVIGTHDGSPSSSDYRDWRFATFVHAYRAMYFELWRLELRKWYLDRAYLSLFRTEQETRLETEMISLHCDPNEPPSRHSPYKIGPHLHIKVAEHPIPLAHIALNKCHLPEVLSSPQALSIAMSEAVLMLKEQFLDAI